MAMSTLQVGSFNNNIAPFYSTSGWNFFVPFFKERKGENRKASKRVGDLLLMGEGYYEAK